MKQTLVTPPTIPTSAAPDVLDAIDRAESSAARVRIAANALHAMGFDRVVITLRDVSLNPTMVVTAGTNEPSAITGYALQPLPGAVWRRRLPQLKRFRVGDLFLLDGSDAWVAREFFAVEPSPRGDGATWLPTDLIVGLLTGVQQERLGFVKLASPRDGRRPNEGRRREISNIIRHLGSRLAYDVLQNLAQRRAERLQRLQEAGAAMARSLDEHEIMRELARQAMRSTGAEGVTIGLPDLDNDRLVTLLRTVRGIERPRSVVRLGDGIIAEVARTGRPVRVGDRVADRAREKAGLAPPLSVYDVVGDSGPAASMLAVPLLAGIHLVGVLAVHASSAEVFSVEDEEVLATMASQAATAVANARRYAESERERRQTEALADVARAVGESLRLGEVLRLILRHSVSLLGAQGACIALRQDDYMHIVAAVGAADVLAGVHLPVSNSLIGTSVLRNELVVSNDFVNDQRSSRAVQRLAHIERTAIAPLMTANGTIGAISVINRDTPFTGDDARVLQRLADHVAVAIVNARLFEEVERATREWKVAFDAIANGMVVLDEAMNVKRCNARAAELCGSDFAQLLGKPFGTAIVGVEASQSATIVALIQRSMLEGTSVREVVSGVPGGQLFELLVAPHPDGGCVVTFDDVTSGHRLAERHRRVLETVSDAIVITDLDGTISFANAAANSLFCTPSLEGQAVATLTPPDDLVEVQRRERAARTGTQQHYECQVVRADGELRLVSVATAPLVEIGKVTGTVSSLRDITEQRQSEEALARSEANYARLLESASDGIFTVDVNGLFTSVNMGMVKATGKRKQQLLGTPYAALLDPRDVNSAKQLHEKTLAGERQRVQIRYVGAEGASRIGVLTTAPIMEAGAVVGGLGIMRDVSDEELLREANSQQSRLANAGELLHGVANELTNPLTSLLALTDLELTSQTLLSADRQALTQIAHEAKRVSRVLTQLLDAAGTSGSAEPILDVDRSVQRALELHAFGRPAGAAPIEVSLHGALPAVRADAQQLHQLLINLLSNADDAIAPAGADGRVYVATDLVDGRIVINVADTGHGIAPADLQRVFEPTFTTNSNRGRRGYGLAIARRIAESNGATLTVQSTLGKGSAFTIAFPVYEPAAEITRDIEPGDGVERTSACRGVLLLVEDEPTLRTAISRFLLRQGFDVVSAQDGKEALAQTAKRHFDLVLLDLRLPDMGGDDVYRTLLAEQPDVATRVLFMTGDLSRTVAADFVKSSGCPVIAKPFQLNELLTTIAHLVPVP
jgi:PAS domain S-box-containing protein